MSVSLDITQGHPQGHSMRTALIGMRIADAIQLPQQDRFALFYSLLLKDLGCSSNAAKIAHLFGGDDHLLKYSIRMIDWTKPAERIKHCWNHCAPEGSLFQKIKAVAGVITTKPSELHDISTIRCDRGAQIARMLQLPEETAQAIYHLDEHWNGQGNPSRLAGSDIPLLSRICCLAQTVEVFYSTSGLDAAYEVAHTRRGKWFDPELVDAMNAFRTEDPFWQQMSSSNLRVHLGRYEPQDSLLLADDDCLDRVAEAFAAVVDAKSPWTFKHSTRVADIAVGTATVLGCNHEVLRDVRRAALLHDIGKLGVSNSILDKPGKPTDEEFAQIRKHPDFTQQILEQVAAFDRLADVAGAHHERLDGRGYHQRRDGQEIPFISRILTVADVFEAMTARRPYREAMSDEQAFEIMARQIGTSFDPACFSALQQWHERNAMESRKPLTPAVLFNETGEKPVVVPTLAGTTGCANGCDKPAGCAGKCAGGCGATAECECGCCDASGKVLNILIGYDSWRGRPDGGWGNFGLHTGFNLGTSLGALSEYTGIGAQIGGTIGVYNWAGSDYRLSNQDQVTTQGFVTLGLFRNADENSHISAGIVQDWMFNETYGVFGEDVVLDQWRAMVGWSFNESDEIGVWGAWRGGTERRNVQNFGRVTWQAHNQVNVFWHHKWPGSHADTWIWVGLPEQDRLNANGTLGDYIAGLYASVPLSDEFSLYTMVNYMNQSATRGAAGAKEDYWNFYVGIAFSPWSSTRTNDVRGRRYAPRLPIANNGLFLVDTTHNY
eukprot:g26619.t1